jgi:hypothetical protein
MVYLQTKIPAWALESKMLVHFMAIWYILRPFGECYVLLLSLWSFGTYPNTFSMLYQ